MRIMRRQSLKTAMFVICAVFGVGCVFLSYNETLFWRRDLALCDLTLDIRHSGSHPRLGATHGESSSLKGSAGGSADDKSPGQRPHEAQEPKPLTTGRLNTIVQPHRPSSARKDNGVVRKDKKAADTENKETYPSAADLDNKAVADKRKKTAGEKEQYANRDKENADNGKKKAGGERFSDTKKQPKGRTADAGNVADKASIADTSKSPEVSDPAMDSTLEELIKTSTSIFKEHGLVLFTVINDAYFQQTASWLCNVASLGHVHPMLLFLSTDVNTGRRLQSRWPEVRVVTYNGTSFSGVQLYNHAGYVRLMMQRTRFINHMLEAHVRLLLFERTRFINHMLEAHVRLLLFEVDVVWLADPLPTILNSSSQPGVDLAVVKVAGTDKLCGCLILLNPTPASKTLWQRKTGLIENLYHEIAHTNSMARVNEKLGNDQASLSHLIRQKVGGVKAAYLSNDLFPDGRWYRLSPAARRAAASTAKPLVIHNNWIMGSPAKIKRSKEFGHWFLLDAGNRTAAGGGSEEEVPRCDLAAVNRVLGVKE